MHSQHLSTNPSTSKPNGHDAPEEPAAFELPPLPEDRSDGQPDDDARPGIRLDEGRYADIVEEIISHALAAGLPIYQHGPYLCQPVLAPRRRRDGTTVMLGVLSNYNTASLRHVLESAMRFLRWDGRKKKWRPVLAPSELMERLLSPAIGVAFPRISGLLQTAILRPNLTLLNKAGFDEATGYFVIDPPPLPPLDLTQAGGKRALAVLADLLSEFPFATGRDRTVAYSALITPLVRAACDVVPAHLFVAPSQGSGKSLLVDLAAAIATGQVAYACTASDKQEESDKQLVGSLLEGRQIIALDNLAGDIRSAILAQAIERPSIEARPLGKSDKVLLENTFNVYLTGNNVRLAGDNTRRVLVCRIDSKHENPIDRTFEKEHPLQRVMAARGEYVAACLTVVLAYREACAEAGEAVKPLNPLPSFGDWSSLVREALVWLGETDPVESIRESFDQDPGINDLGALISAIAASPVVDPWTARSLVEVANSPGQSVLYDALMAVAEVKGNINNQRLGFYLLRNKDRPVDGRRIVTVKPKDQTAHRGTALWKLA